MYKNVISVTILVFSSPKKWSAEILSQLCQQYSAARIEMYRLGVMPGTVSCVLLKPNVLHLASFNHPSVSIPKHLPPWVPMNIASGAGWSDEAWRKVKHQSEYKRVRHKSRFIRLVFQPSVRGLGFCRLHSWAAYCWPAPAVVVVAAVAGGASCHPPTFAFHTFQFEWEKSGSNSVTLKRIHNTRQVASGDEK